MGKIATTLDPKFYQHRDSAKDHIILTYLEKVSSLDGCGSNGGNLA